MSLKKMFFKTLNRMCMLGVLYLLEAEEELDKTKKPRLILGCFSSPPNGVLSLGFFSYRMRFFTSVSNLGLFSTKPPTQK